MEKEKEAELWDDSALITAFHQSISNFKKMHTNGYQDSLTEEEIVTSGTKKTVYSLSDECYEAKRVVDEADADHDIKSITVKETGTTYNWSPCKEIHHVDSTLPESALHSSNGGPLQDELDNNSQGAEDEYTRLYNQYNELEEQRQKVLQQLYQLGGWNDQYTPNIQEHQDAAYEASPPNCVHSCPQVSQCLVGPGCLPDGNCAGNTCTGNSFPFDDHHIIKTAMVAAERALSSVKNNACSISGGAEEKARAGEKDEGVVGQSTSSETDLTDVLKAWYSAGFYTGKYLTEQSIAKKQQS